MIITVQGNYGKKNKSVLATALIGGMAAVTNGSRTLILQLIDKDMDSVESMFTGLSKDSNTFGKNDGTTSFANEGIDALLRAADNTKLTADDFKQYCTSFNKKDHGLDVTQMTEINNFREVCKTKIESVKKICKNAKDYYENILILMPTGDEELSRAINGDGEEQEGFADMSIYCLKQGHVKTEHYFGRKVIFLVTDYDSASKFSLKSMRKNYCQKNDSIYKIERNVGCNDAYLSGKLLEFILTNRDAKEYDTNYQWAEDVKAVVRQIENISAKEEVVNYEWEKILIEEEKKLKTLPETIIDMEELETRQLETKKENQQKKKRSIFTKSTKNEDSPVATEINTDAPATNVEDEVVGLRELEETTSEENASEIERIDGPKIEYVTLGDNDDPENILAFEPVTLVEEREKESRVQSPTATEAEDETDDFVFAIDVEDTKLSEESKSEDDQYLKELYEETTDQMLREAFEQDEIKLENAGTEIEEPEQKPLADMTNGQKEPAKADVDEWSWDESFSSDENKQTIQQMQSQMDQLSRQIEALAQIVTSQAERNV